MFGVKNDEQRCGVNLTPFGRPGIVHFSVVLVLKRSFEENLEFRIGSMKIEEFVRENCILSIRYCAFEYR